MLMYLSILYAIILLLLHLSFVKKVSSMYIEVFTHGRDTLYYINNFIIQNLLGSSLSLSEEEIYNFF